MEFMTGFFARRTRSFSRSARRKTRVGHAHKFSAVEGKMLERLVVVQLSVTDSKSAYVPPPASEALPPNAPNLQDLS